MQRAKELFLALWFPLAFLALFLIIRTILGWTDPAGATKELEKAGFANIQTTGYEFVWGSRGLHHTGFVATTNGREVRGSVTTGRIFRPATINLK